jgi:hypothetical protein
MPSLTTAWPAVGSTSRVTAARRRCGRYLRYAGVGPIQIAVAVDLLRWAKRRHTPLWLEVAVEPGDAFRVLEAEQPPRVLFAGYKGRPYVPLTLPLHVEHQDAWRGGGRRRGSAMAWTA